MADGDVDSEPDYDLVTGGGVVYDAAGTAFWTAFTVLARVVGPLALTPPHGSTAPIVAADDISYGVPRLAVADATQYPNLADQGQLSGYLTSDGPVVAPPGSRLRAPSP